MLTECIRGCSGFRNTPGFNCRTAFDACCPVTACEVTCNDVATDCSNVPSSTFGPTGFNPFGNSTGPNSTPSTSHARRP